MDHETAVAYLNRVGVTVPAVCDAAGLRTLHRAHQQTVPFENLSIHLAEPIPLDERDLADKIVRRRRGGFCYHEIKRHAASHELIVPGHRPPRQSHPPRQCGVPATPKPPQTAAMSHCCR